VCNPSYSQMIRWQIVFGHHFWPRLMARGMNCEGEIEHGRVQMSEMTNGTKWVIKYGAQALWYHLIEKLHQLLHFIAHFL
jgi:hypothetical protein